MSLAGRRVVVTRSPEQSPELARALEARGATVVSLSAVIVAPPADPAPLERAARSGDYDWILFASHNAVARFFAVEGATVGRAHLGAVGAKTAEAVRRSAGAGASVLTPERHDARSLLALLPAELGGQRALVPRAPEGRPDLVDGLAARGARVDAPEAYRLCAAPAPSPEQVEAAAGADVYTFLSGRTLEAFLEIVPDARAMLARGRVAVIGPVAATAAAAAGVRVDVVPEVAAVEALVAALDREA